MESIPREATFVRKALVWNGLAFIMLFGSKPLLSKNIIELTKNFKSQLGVNDKILANLSVSLEFALDLFWTIVEDNLLLISNIFSLPVKGSFTIVSIPSSHKSFFIAKET